MRLTVSGTVSAPIATEASITPLAQDRDKALYENEWIWLSRPQCANGGTRRNV
jgi:hypothetical protein